MTPEVDLLAIDERRGYEDVNPEVAWEQRQELQASSGAPTCQTERLVYEASDAKDLG